VAGGRGREGYARIKPVVGACREHCGLRQEQVACASKIHYMRAHNGRPGDVDEIVGMGRKAGWRMSAGSARAGLRLLGRLGLGDGAAA